jgi:hypothetical protein
MVDLLSIVSSLSSGLETDFKKSLPKFKLSLWLALIQLIIYQSPDGFPVTSKNFSGSIRSPLFCNSKRKCVPVERPLLATSAMTCSAEISSPYLNQIPGSMTVKGSIAASML